MCVCSPDPRALPVWEECMGVCPSQITAGCWTGHSVKPACAEVNGEWPNPTANPTKYLCSLERKTKKPELFGTDLGRVCKFPKYREKYQLLTKEILNGSGAFSGALFWGEEK